MKRLNSRLDTPQAAILRVKLRHLDDWNARPRRHAEASAEALGDADLSRRRTPIATWAGESLPMNERKAAEMVSLRLYSELEPGLTRKVAEAVRRRLR